MKITLLIALGVLVLLNLLLLGNATQATALSQDILLFGNYARITEANAPEIIAASMNILNAISGTGEGAVDDISYAFEGYIDAEGDFSTLEVSDVRISVNGEALNIREVKVSQDGEVFHIMASGDFGGIPPFGEYDVTVEDASGQTSASFSIGVLGDSPKDAPEILFPKHLDSITETQPTFRWEEFESVYLGQLVVPWAYEIDLAFPNGDVFTAWPIAGSQTTLDYQHPGWNPSQPPNLLPGSYSLTIHSNHHVTPGFNFEHHRVIHFEVALAVKIDIKPGSDSNCINPNDHGVIPVAILTTETFDASTVDAFSVQLEGSGVRVKGKSGNAGSLEDVDEDGDLDLVVHIVDSATLTGHDTATLTGSLLPEFGGTVIEGTDTICIVP